MNRPWSTDRTTAQGIQWKLAAPGARTPERLTGELATPDGKLPMSANLVVRFAGPGRLLGAGHTADGANLGLARSGDHGATWTPVSGLG